MQETSGVLGVYDLKATMARKGADFGPECQIFEVCAMAPATIERPCSFVWTLPAAR